jgi:hypothetical protein
MSEITFKVTKISRSSSQEFTDVITEVTYETVHPELGGVVFTQSFTYDPSAFTDYSSLTEADVVSWMDPDLAEIAISLAIPSIAPAPPKMPVFDEVLTLPFAQVETPASEPESSSEQDTTSTDTTSTDTTSTDTTSTGGGE